MTPSETPGYVGRTFRWRLAPAGCPRTLFPPTLPLIMADRFSELKSFIEDAEKDFQQFYEKGNKAAGTRVRKAMQDLKQKAQDIRMEVQDMKKSDS